MNREQFEARVLDLWMTTRIPLTRAHLQYHTGVSRRRLNRWLDDMVTDGVVECDVDDDGEMLWAVPGAERPLDGPATFAAAEKRDQIRSEARRKVRAGRGGGGGSGGGSGSGSGSGGDKDSLALIRRQADDAAFGLQALTLARRASSQALTSPPDGEKRKSLLLSTGLSFLGPLGWLYAGSLREAIPATLLALVVAKIIPSFLLMPILWLAMPLSALAGLVYAWQYNRHGHRTPLFLDDKKDGKDA